MSRLESSHLPLSAARDAAEWIRQKVRGDDLRPSVGVVLGSGLNALFPHAEIRHRFDFRDIPHFAPTTVEGHSGVVEIGHVQEQPVVVLRGRYHFYEGHAPQRLALPVRMLHELGVKTLVVTNAAGGLNPEFQKGDLMVMRDHIGLPTLAGFNPLIGPNDDDLGPRFPPMASAYDPELIKLTQKIAHNAKVDLREGVYIMVSGPTYETPAEMRALRTLGADAVGMSTVPEVIAARHVGMKVLGISCITNAATPETADKVSHTEVLDGAQITGPKLDRLLSEFLQALKVNERIKDADISGQQLPVAPAYAPSVMPDVLAAEDRLRGPRTGINRFRRMPSR